jgi:hypothetical protein
MISRDFEHPKRLSPKNQLEMLKKLDKHEQRSPEWFAARKDKLTSSDAATALGINPYQKPVELLFKKCGHGKPFTGNVATLYGQKYEDEAIGQYCKALGKRNHDFGLLDFDAVYRPDDEYSQENYKTGIPWMAGSTDGVAEDIYDKEHLILLEVKCPYRRKIKFGKIPDYYFPQVQLNMAILNIEKADFIEYKPAMYGEPMQLNIVRLYRDRDWFDKNVPILDAFWKEVLEWRTKDITTHPLYEKYHKPPRKKKLKIEKESKPLFIESSSDDDDDDDE